MTTSLASELAAHNRVRFAPALPDDAWREQLDTAYGEVRAVCDVNPAHLARAAATLSKTSRPPARQYAEWRDMLQKEDLEAVIVAAPLWMHAEIATGCLEAGRHVLCEKMMAWDIEGAERMRDAAARSHRILEIGYQRFYNPMYRAAYEGVRELLPDQRPFVFSRSGS